MEHNSNPNALTATRRRIGGKAKAVVMVTDQTGAVILRAGGNRAERAAAAIVTLSGVTGALRLELRADLAAAQAEAERNATRTEVRHGGAVIAVTPAAWSVALPVADETKAAPEPTVDPVAALGSYLAAGADL